MKNSYGLENHLLLGDLLQLGIFTKKILMQSAAESFPTSEISDLVKEKKAFPCW